MRRSKSGRSSSDHGLRPTEVCLESIGSHENDRAETQLPDGGEEIEAPIVPAARVTGLHIELDLAEQLEARVAADGVREFIVGGGEGMQEARPAHLAGMLGEKRHGLDDNPLTLKFGEQAPADLPDLLTLPGPLPVPNGADRLSIRAEGD